MLLSLIAYHHSAISRCNDAAASAAVDALVRSIVPGSCACAAALQLSSMHQAWLARRMRHLTALAAACSLSDDMAAWADSMRWRFGLWDPSVQRLMSHALAGQAARQPRPLAELQRELPCRRGSGGPSTPGGTRKFEETDSDDSSDNEAHRFYLGETGPSQVRVHHCVVVMACQALSCLRTCMGFVLHDDI